MDSSTGRDPDETAGAHQPARAANMDAASDPVRPSGTSTGSPQGRKAALATVVAMGASVGSANAIASFVPLLSPRLEEVGVLSPADVGLILGASGLGLVCVVVAAGHYTDRAGPRPVFLTGVGLSVAAAIAATSWQAVAVLAVAAFVGGVAQGLQTISTMAAIARALPRNLTTGYAAYGVATGVVWGVELLAAGWLADAGAARFAFALGIPACAIGSLAVARSRIARDSALTGRRRDAAGISLSILAAAALFIGPSLLIEDPNSPAAVAFTVLGLGLVVALLSIERRAPRPALNFQLLANATVAKIAIIGAMAGFAAAGLGSLAAEYALLVLDLPASSVAILTAGGVSLSAAAALASPALLRWLGARTLVSFAFMIAAAAVAARAAFLGPGTHGNVLVAVAIVPVMLAAVTAPLRSIIAGALPGGATGAGFALVNVIRRFAALMGVAVVLGTFSADFAAMLPTRLAAHGVSLPEGTDVTSVGQALKARATPSGDSTTAEYVEDEVFLDAQRIGLESAAVALGIAAITGATLPGKHRRRRRQAAGP